MNEHMKEQITNILKETLDQDGEIRSRATAFSFMKGILENGEPALTQMKDLEEILYIWNSLQ